MKNQIIKILIQSVFTAILSIAGLFGVNVLSSCTSTGNWDATFRKLPPSAEINYRNPANDNIDYQNEKLFNKEF